MSTTWTADACAAHWGVTRDSWMRYVRAGRAPKHDHYDPETGERVWLEAAVRAWQRPGQGVGGGRPRKTADTPD